MGYDAKKNTHREEMHRQTRVFISKIEVFSGNSHVLLPFGFVLVLFFLNHGLHFTNDSTINRVCYLIMVFSFTIVIHFIANQNCIKDLQPFEWSRISVLFFK